MKAGLPRDEKLCEGCGKDLSIGGGFDDGTTRIGLPRTLWRCASCKIAKDTLRISQLEAGINSGLNALANVNSDHKAEHIRASIDAAYGTLRAALQNEEPV